jgi:hypothetical protein
MDANKLKEEIEKNKKQGIRKMSQLIKNNSKTSLDPDEEEQFEDVRMA